MANKLLKSLSLGTEQMDILTNGFKVNLNNGKLDCLDLRTRAEGYEVTLPSATTDHTRIAWENTAPPRLAIITWFAQFEPNATGLRYAGLEYGPEESKTLLTSVSRLKATPSGFTMLTGFETIWSEDSDRKYYLRLYQNSGTTLDVYVEYYVYEL